MPVTFTTADSVATIQASISANAPDTFTFEAGVYSLLTFEAESDSIFQGELDADGNPLTIFDGSVDFLGSTGDWVDDTATSGFWYRTETHSPTSTASTMQTGFSNGNKDYHISINGEFAIHVDDETDLENYATANQYQFYLDDGNNRLYVNSTTNPASTFSTLRKSTLKTGIYGNNKDNVTIRRIEGRHYAMPLKDKWIDADNWDNFEMTNMYIHDMNGIGFSIENNGLAHTNDVRRTGHVAFNPVGQFDVHMGTWVYNNKFIDQGLSGNETTDENGSIKLAFVKDFRFTHNYLKQNSDKWLHAIHGMWADIDWMILLCKYNYIEGFPNFAGFAEIGGHDAPRSHWSANFFRNNGMNSADDGLVRLAMLGTDNASNIVWYRNYVVAPTGSGKTMIGIRLNKRSTSGNGGWDYDVQNVTYCRNEIWIEETGGVVGIRDNDEATDYSASQAVNDQATNDIRFDYNTYNHPASDDIFYKNPGPTFNAVNMNFATWQGTHGNDPNGTENVITGGESMFSESRDTYLALGERFFDMEYHNRVDLELDPAISLHMDYASGNLINYGDITATPSFSKPSGWEYEESSAEPYDTQAMGVNTDTSPAGLDIHSEDLEDVFCSTGSWSIHIWAKIDASVWQAGIDYNFFKIGSSGGVGEAEAYMRIENDSPASTPWCRWAIRWDTSSETVTTIDMSGTAIDVEDGEYHLFSYVYDNGNGSSGGGVKGYVDGVEVASIADSASGFNYNSASLTVRDNRIVLFGQSTSSNLLVCRSQGVWIQDRVPTTQDWNELLDVNKAPVITSSGGTVNIDEGVTPTTLTATDEDGETVSAGLTWSLQSGTLPTGVSAFNANGSFTGTCDVPGSYGPLVFRCTDTVGEYDEVTITYSVAEAVNDAPVITSAGGTVNIDEGTTPATLTATDEDFDSFTWSIQSGSMPTGTTFNSDGTTSGTADVPGSYGPITFRVTDEGGLYDEVVITYVVAEAVNDTPVITSSPGTINLNEGDSIASLTATDEDFDSFTWTIQSGGPEPTGTTFNSDGSFSGTCSSAGTFGPITFRVTDGGGLFDEVAITYEVSAVSSGTPQIDPVGAPPISKNSKVPSGDSKRQIP